MAKFLSKAAVFYLRTVIVTADIHWDLKTELRLAANKIF